MTVNYTDNEDEFVHACEKDNAANIGSRVYFTAKTDAEGNLIDCEWEEYYMTDDQE